MKRDLDKYRAWQRASVRRYEDRLRSEGSSRFRSLGRNRERTAKRRERDFGDKADLIRRQRCDACGAPPPSDPHHDPTRAAGGTAKDTLPLCRSCHRLAHDHGKETFREITGLDTRERAAYWEAVYRQDAP